MSDHRDIPGIEFVSCPGPLRLGDYTCPQSRGPTTEITRIDGSIPLLTKGLWSIWRVIPVIKPLDVPEPCDPETPEIITWSSPLWGCFRVGANTVDFSADGYAIGFWYDEPEYLSDPQDLINHLAEQSEHDK